MRGPLNGRAQCVDPITSQCRYGFDGFNLAASSNVVLENVDMRAIAGMGVYVCTT
jgi:hypothetical protein